MKGKSMIADSSITLMSSKFFEQQIKSTSITISGTLNQSQARALVYEATNGAIDDFDITTVRQQDNQPNTLTAEQLLAKKATERLRCPYDDLREYKQKIMKNLLEFIMNRRRIDFFSIFGNESIQNTGQNPNVVTTIRITQIELYERESFVFEASGSVTTSDGRIIDLSVSLSMSRELYTKIDSSSFAQVIQLTDPLVINFNTDSARLSDMKFHFDLDASGTPSQISVLKGGSGFLAIDTYGDGSIRDGSQLFGTQSGNGFTDLAEYDATNDGWVDKNDPIFDKLRVWVKDEYGNDTLFALGELGIGAIFVGSVETSYSLYDTDVMNGKISHTGVFLRNDGTVGTIQHVDMRV